MARKSTLIASGISLYQQTGKELFGKYLMTQGATLVADKENQMVFLGRFEPADGNATSNAKHYWCVAIVVKRRDGRHMTYAKFYPAEEQGKAQRQYRKIHTATELPVYRSPR